MPAYKRNQLTRIRRIGSGRLCPRAAGGSGATDWVAQRMSATPCFAAGTLRKSPAAHHGHSPGCRSGMQVGSVTGAGHPCPAETVQCEMATASAHRMSNEATSVIVTDGQIHRDPAADNAAAPPPVRTLLHAAPGTVLPMAGAGWMAVGARPSLPRRKAVFRRACGCKRTCRRAQAKLSSGDTLSTIDRRVP